jgi:hypothetical protein
MCRIHKKWQGSFKKYNILEETLGILATVYTIDYAKLFIAWVELC